jgi:hypothetical protein
VKEKLYQILNDKWLDIGVLWRATFRRQIGLEGLPRKTNRGQFDQHLWDEYLREMNITHPAVEVHFLGRETEHYFIENPAAKEKLVGVPKELAMKALVLGHFPDSPSIEKMRDCFHEPSKAP